MKYSIVERFYSVQGEGIHMGRAAYFVRLYGCNQGCSFCDSAETWHPAWKPPHLPLLEAEAVAALVDVPQWAGLQIAGCTPFVVITGGEPALYDLQPLVDAIHRRSLRVHIETAGHKPLPRGLDWVTMSPKLFAAPPLPENWQRADEIKLIVSSREQMEADLKTVLNATMFRDRAPVIWLHPEWSQRDNPAVLTAIVEAVKEDPRLRAGYQLHKLYQADLLDPNSRKQIIPLGGVPQGSVPVQGQ